MQLIYRGTTFDYNPAHINARHPAQRSGSAYELIYRGDTYRVDPTVAAIASAKPMEYELIYRGSTYYINCNKQGEIVAIAPTNSPKHGTETTHPAMQKAASRYSL